VVEDRPAEGDGDKTGDKTNGNRTGGWARRLGQISVDWWATAVVGLITLLAIAGVLPKIPW
jgi:hypothetical protein